MLCGKKKNITRLINPRKEGRRSRKREQIEQRKGYKFEKIENYDFYLGIKEQFWLYFCEIKYNNSISMKYSFIAFLVILHTSSREEKIT
jgi:hypothetical protein